MSAAIRPTVSPSPLTIHQSCVIDESVCELYDLVPGTLVSPNACCRTVPRLGHAVSNSNRTKQGLAQGIPKLKVRYVQKNTAAERGEIVAKSGDSNKGRLRAKWWLFQRFFRRRSVPCSIWAAHAKAESLERAFLDCLGGNLGK